MAKVLERKDIKESLKWRLEDIYKSDKAWEEDFTWIAENAPKLARYKGRLCESAETLSAFYKEDEKISRKLEKLFCYANMRQDEDSGNSKYQEMLSRATVLYMQISAELAFTTPEMIKAGEKKLLAFAGKDKKLKEYEFEFKELFRNKKHVLSEKEERLMSLSMDALGTADEVFSMFNDADIRFGNVRNEKGKEIELTHGRYSPLMQNKNREVRKEAFTKLYKAYSDFKNTLAAAYAGNVKTDCFCTKARKYESALEASLSGDNVPVAVYENLIETIHNNLDKQYEYLKLRKRALGLKELHMYDLYVPFAQMPAKKYSYEEAQKLVLEAVKPLGDDYCKIIKEAFSSRWIDVCENRGKRSGAYSCGVYGVHPYVLLNWQGEIGDVFTLAHELGHAMHSYYSNKTQPMATAGYKIFVAEVASTVNENLLFKYLLSKTTNRKERLYLINHYLEEFRATMYRQVMFAEFEKKAHELLEQGGALTADALYEIYYNLNKLYFGPVVKVDREIGYEWSRIPHFYSSFYVYKYATGFASAVALADNILSGDKNKIKAYRDFLRSGGSDYPMELLKKAGVDLTTTEPIQKALDVFGENVELLKNEK